MKMIPLFVIAMLGITFLLGCTTQLADTTGGDTTGDLSSADEAEIMGDVDDSIIDESEEIDLGEMI